MQVLLETAMPETPALIIENLVRGNHSFKQNQIISHIKPDSFVRSIVSENLIMNGKGDVFLKSHSHLTSFEKRKTASPMHINTISHSEKDRY